MSLMTVSYISWLDLMNKFKILYQRLDFSNLLICLNDFFLKFCHILPATEYGLIKVSSEPGPHTCCLFFALSSVDISRIRFQNHIAFFKCFIKYRSNHIVKWIFVNLLICPLIFKWPFLVWPCNLLIFNFIRIRAYKIVFGIGYYILWAASL